MNCMKKISVLVLPILFAFISQAQQLLKVTPGTDITIVSGTTFRVDSLTLTPSADFTLSNNTLSKATTAVHSGGIPYIARVYQFAGNTNSFTGTVQINYTDGAELNSIPEN